MNKMLIQAMHLAICTLALSACGSGMNHDAAEGSTTAPPDAGAARMADAPSRVPETPVRPPVAAPEANPLQHTNNGAIDGSENGNDAATSIQTPPPMTHSSQDTPPDLSRDDASWAHDIEQLPLELGSPLCPLKYQRPDLHAATQSGMDPRFAEQWYLKNTGSITGFSGLIAGEDLRVEPVWNAGMKGEGIRIAVLDDAMELTHPDLWSNVVPGSYNYRAIDKYGKPSSVLHGGTPVGLLNFPLPCDKNEHHGTAVAGIIAARDGNGIGISGVSPRAQLVGMNILASDITGDTLDALVRDLDKNHIYNNSWGAPDEGHLTPPLPNWQAFNETLQHGLKTGRQGRGAIYVFAAGNGAIGNDYSSLDGSVSALGVINVCASNAKGTRAPYSERGSNLTVCAPSADVLDKSQPAIVTTAPQGDYIDSFNGTSAAAPMVSGVIALMLQARPELTWRDIPLILARSARQVDTEEGGWSDSVSPLGYGNQYDRLHYSHQYGFGVVNAASAVQLSKRWHSVGGSESLKKCGPFQASSQSDQEIPEVMTVTDQWTTATPDTNIVTNPELQTFVKTISVLNKRLDYNVAPEKGLRSSIRVPDNCKIQHIEHIDVTVTATDDSGKAEHPSTGDLQIALVSPSHTVSTLMVPHTCINIKDDDETSDTSTHGTSPAAPQVSLSNCQGGLTDFTFGVRRHLDEPIANSGNRTWQLVAADRIRGKTGRLKNWQITFYGR